MRSHGDGYAVLAPARVSDALPLGSESPTRPLHGPHAEPLAHNENNQAQSQTGTWKYDKEKNRINVSGVSSVKLTRTTGSVSSSYYEIQKLDDQALWYAFVNGSDRHEFRFVKK